MPRYAGTKSFARIRAQHEAKHGKKMSELDMWLETHESKKVSKLDDASAATKQAIENELALLPEVSSNEARNEIFKKVVGDDKNGYAKMFGMGVKVPRSHGKRCVLEEERAKRLKSKEQVADMKSQLKEAFDEIGQLKDLVIKLCKHRGLLSEEV